MFYRTILELKISNILGERLDEVYNSFKAADQPYGRVYPATSFDIGLKYKL